MKFLLLMVCLPLTAWADRDIERLKEIVNINSGSANLSGVTKVMETVKPWFQDLGFTVVLHKNPLDEKLSGPLFVAELKGREPKKVTFLMHADTVFEPSSPFQTYKFTAPDTISGPGVMDDKGGIIVTLKALKKYLEVEKVPKYSLRVVITPNEEVGGTGFQQRYLDFSLDSWLVLGMEPAHEAGDIVEGRKGNRWIEINVQGKEAHAGRDHKAGVNACHILSEKIAEIKKLTDYKKNVTVSVGRIEGGQDKFNIVCGWARAKIDTRFADLQSRDDLFKKILKIIDDPRISHKIEDDTNPFNKNALSAPVIEKYLAVIKRIEGVSAKSFMSSGVGDSNAFSRPGIIILDGLGPIGSGLHTEEERVSLKSFETRSEILATFLREI